MKCLVLLTLLMTSPLNALKLDRVILATDAHENYIHFWPLVAKAWKEVVGLQPTLALIGDDSIQVDETLGDVIRFKPISGVPTSLQAQTIRLLLPALFPDEGCIVSDIDMMPLQKDYFIEPIRYIPDTKFIVFRDGAYGWMKNPRYPMCYVAATGKLFSEVFNVKNIEQIPLIIEAWHQEDLGWNTDEILLYKYLQDWQKKTNRLVALGHGTFGRVDRLDWRYDINSVRSAHYIDAHMPRPYHSFKDSIDTLIEGLLDTLVSERGQC